MSSQENLEMDDVLEKITFYSFDEARKSLEENGSCTPFTVVVQGDEMFVEEYPQADVVSCRADAEANVKSSSSFSTHYAFCYDGFLMTDDGQIDALVVECAQRDMERAYTIALVYKEHDGAYDFAQTPAYIDDAESFYDAAAVRAAEARELVESESDAEMDEVQEMLKRNLSGDEAGKAGAAEPGEPAAEGSGA